MATSSVSSSTSWINNSVVFDQLIHSNSIDMEQINTCITPEARKGVVRGLKQFIYWKGRLQYLVSSHVLIFTCITPQGLAKPNVHFFKRQINDIIGRGKVASIYYPENSNFIGFVFHEAVEAQLVRQRVASVDGAPVCYMGEKDSNEYQIRILWMPFKNSCDEVRSALRKYCKVIDIAPESLQFEDGDTLPSNILSGSVTFNDDVRLSNFPHILKITGTPDFYVLLVIKERPPLCLRCRQPGHIRRQCDYRKCTVCNSHHTISGGCFSKSYASVTRPIYENLLEGDLVNEGVDCLNENPECQNFSTSSYISSAPSQQIAASDSTPCVNEVIGPSSLLSHGLSTHSEAGARIQEKPGMDEFKLISRRVTRSMKKREGKANTNFPKNVIPQSVVNSTAFDILDDEMDSLDGDAHSEENVTDSRDFNPLENMKGLDHDSSKGQLPSSDLPSNINIFESGTRILEHSEVDIEVDRTNMTSVGASDKGTIPPTPHDVDDQSGPEQKKGKFAHNVESSSLHPSQDCKNIDCSLHGDVRCLLCDSISRVGWPLHDFLPCPSCGKCLAEKKGNVFHLISKVAYLL